MADILDSEQLKRNILSDIRVELTEEFDRNFERKAFFDKRWPKRRYNNPKGSLLMVTGTLRRSIRSTTSRNGVRFTSAVPYAAIHNEGGSGTKTVRSHTRRGKGGKTHAVRAHSRRFKIPERRFIGDHPRVHDIINNVVKDNIEAFATALARQLKTK